MDLQKRKILVTGGAGAIGSNLVKRLVSDFNADIVAVDTLIEGHLSNLKNVTCKYVHQDINDYFGLEKLFESEKFDAVFHLAASFANQKSIDNPVIDLQTNVQGTLHLLMLSQKFKIKYFMYTSSSCVYGNATELMKEDQKLHPDTPYAISKLTAEYYVKFYADFYKLPATSIRFFNVYGPGEFPGKYRNVIPKFISLALEGKPLTVMGTGSETRSFTYIDDAIDAMFLIVKKGDANGEVYNISSGTAVTIKELAVEINKATNNKTEITMVPKRNWDTIVNRQADISKIQKLGFKPKTKLSDGIKSTVKWFKET